MSGNNDTIVKTFVVATVLCLVCSICVTSAAVALKDMQEANKLLDKQKNILSVVGLLEEGTDVAEAFKQVEARAVEIASGQFTDAVDVATYDQRAAAKDPAQNFVIPKELDIAKIGSRAKNATVYLVRNEDKSIKYIILPVHGKGLWSTLYGFLALEGDANTVVGLSFYEHAETPGLGGEVDNPKWRAIWPGKKVFDASGVAQLGLVKGAVDNSKPEAVHQVDGLSGATLTSVGVTYLVQFWTGEHGFKAFLDQIRAKG